MTYPIYIEDFFPARRIDYYFGNQRGRYNIDFAPTLPIRRRLPPFDFSIWMDYVRTFACASQIYISVNL